MITSLGRHAVTATTVFALGGLSAIAAQTPAQAGSFTAGYTCNISNLGQTSAVLSGWLTSPGTTFSGPARFRLHISSLSLQSPVPVDSWSATAWINVRGAENTTFQVAGGGGSIPALGAMAGDLVGDWAPVMGGTDLLSVGGLEITANSAEAGSVPVQCVPNGAPVADVLRVASPYHGRWIHPAVPLFHVGGWYRPGMSLHRPVWARPGRPGGWNRPGVPIHPGHPGGWNRPGVPIHPGHPIPGHPILGHPIPGHPVVPGHPGGWNLPGVPIHHGGPIAGMPHHH